MGIETEIKVELPDYHAYLKIYGALGVPQLYLTQENIYFDSSDQVLHSLGVMFRLRIENEKKIFTVKSGSKIENGVQQAKENEFSVAELDFSQAGLHKILTQLCTIAIPESLELKKLGSILNKRVVFENFFNVKLELDHTQIFEKHYYEIEVETDTPDYHLLKIKELLLQNQIEFKPSSSKYGRFLNELRTKSEK
jgi:uncharacterized protein YjbK